MRVIIYRHNTQSIKCVRCDNFKRAFSNLDAFSSSSLSKRYKPAIFGDIHKFYILTASLDLRRWIKNKCTCSWSATWSWPEGNKNGFSYQNEQWGIENWKEAWELNLPIQCQNQWSISFQEHLLEQNEIKSTCLSRFGTVFKLVGKFTYELGVWSGLWNISWTHC